jgi:beta-N-acetylhexosaminidase
MLVAGCGSSDSADETTPPPGHDGTATAASGNTTTPGAASPTAVPATATPVPTQEPSVAIMAGQMLMAGVDGTSLSDDARHVIGDLHVGNVVLMGRNVSSPAQVLALTQALQRYALEQNGVPLLIATDQEGGSVQRLQQGFTRLPDALTVGKAGDPDLARALGKAAGEELAAVGVNVDFAPVLDVNDNPANPVIGPRAFGSTPDVVQRIALPFAAGLGDAGVAVIGKHFPGHGNTSTDSHFSLPVVTKDRAGLDRTELPPFEAAIKAGIDGLMIAHVAYPALDPSGLPATISSPIVSGLLRGELNFGGVVFTDDMGMEGLAELTSPEEAAIHAINAGADILLCVRMDQAGSCPPASIERLQSAIVTAVTNGTLSKARVEQSYRRVMALKTKYHAGPASGTGLDQVGGTAHQEVVTEIQARAGG